MSSAFPPPGWPPPESFLPPFPPIPNPFAADTPAPDTSSGPTPGSNGSATPPVPPRSVLFNQPQPNWGFDSALIARRRAAAALDADADELGEGELPRSKSGAPDAPPSFSAALPLSFELPQWRDIAHWLSPNIVDYFTKTLPPAPPFPPTPRKIPSTDPPYGPGAAFEAATWIPAVLERIGAIPLVRVAGIAEKAATDAALQAAKTAAERASTASTLERLQAYVTVGPYGKLSGKLPAGWQAHHLNQNRVYGVNIPRNEGISVPMRGNILTEPGTPHHIFHRSVEQFWDQFRNDGSLMYSMPTNAEYGDAVRRAFIESGLFAAQASDLAAQGAAQRVAAGLSESAKVPRIPGRIWRQWRD